MTLLKHGPWRILWIHFKRVETKKYYWWKESCISCYGENTGNFTYPAQKNNMSPENRRSQTEMSSFHHQVLSLDFRGWWQILVFIVCFFCWFSEIKHLVKQGWNVRFLQRKKMGPKAHWVYRSDARELKKAGRIGVSCSCLLLHPGKLSIITGWNLKISQLNKRSCSIHLHFWVPC